MSRRPDHYAPLPVGFFRHPTTHRARGLHDKAPEAFLVLVAEAEAQHRRGSEPGQVKLAFPDFAVCAGLGGTDTLEVLDAIERVGWIAYERDEWGFEATLPNFQQWSGDPQAQARKKRHEQRGESEVKKLLAGEESIFSAEHLRLCRLLATLVRGNYPKAKVRPESFGWLNECRLLIDADGHSPQDVERVIRFCAADDFEKANVQAMPKLRKRFDNLYAKACKAPGGVDDSAWAGRWLGE